MVLMKALLAKGVPEHQLEAGVNAVLVAAKTRLAANAPGAQVRGVALGLIV